MASSAAHFRARDRRAVRLSVELLSHRSGVARPAVVTDLSLAGAGLETDEPLLAGERVSVTLATPTMWDPLVLEAVVAWAHPPRPSHEVDAVGRSRTVARAGIAFEYPTPAAILAMFEMLATLGYE
ncbi:MAG TPA: PilZ domain-containing protein [Labilithrix sp.]|nr:PilZ domain-containing protein [Labilithrix sp.]